jgi:hypothetical protein
MSVCMCGKRGVTVTTICDGCLQPLCRSCATIVMPKKSTGDIEIKHFRCMPKKYRQNKLKEE